MEGKWLPRLAALRRASITALAGVGASVILVTATPAVHWYAKILAGEWCECGGDVLIVLGGSALETHVVGASTYWRSVYALRAYRSAKFGWILLSGAGAAPAMREFLMFQGVPEGVIRVENRSTTTRENALAARAMLAACGESLPGAGRDCRHKVLCIWSNLPYNGASLPEGLEL